MRTNFINAMNELTGNEKEDIHIMDIPGMDVSLRQMLFILCWEIEKLPPSDQQTKVITLACELRSEIFRMGKIANPFVEKLKQEVEDGGAEISVQQSRGRRGEIMFRNTFGLCGMKIFENVNCVELTGKQLSREEARNWKERIFSLPWQPWKATKTIYYPETKPAIYRIGNSIVGHPAKIAELKSEIERLQKEPPVKRGE